jgi:hypothetical protein
MRWRNNRTLRVLRDSGWFFAVLGGTGGIASRAAPEATPRPPRSHLVANR